MNKQYFLNNEGTFIIDDYNQAPSFSNFLPGVSGIWGIPLWVFYVNRGQAVISFGIKDKNHSIAEYFPANKAYSFVSTLGFRTFYKINKKDYYEPFQGNCDNEQKQQMLIDSAAFKIKDTNPSKGLETIVKYFTLPNTSVGGLVRVLSIKNISNKKVDLEVLDGLSRIVPFGSIHPFLKDMSRTLEAWMHAFIQDNLAIFRLIVDPRDVSQTEYIEGGNFNFSFYENNGKRISPYIIADPNAVFGQNLSLSFPENFLKKDFKTPLPQINCGKTPCALSHFKWSLNPGQQQNFYSIFGSSFKLEQIKKFTRPIDAKFLNRKDTENEQIIDGIKNNAFSSSASKTFDHYVKNTYLDNVLRGGWPYRLSPEENSEQNIYYVFSRKHGDLERDYNHFQLAPAYFSEGEANYRDINQNRRMDLFFEPSLEAKNIRHFVSLIRLDGYNPLVVKGEKLHLTKEQAKAVLAEFKIKDQRTLNLMLKGFYLGELFKLLEEEGIKVAKKEKLAEKVLKISKREFAASFGEGFWIDHWHYNLDLIESFLYFYPDKLGKLFTKEEFTFWDDEHFIKPRSQKYHLRSGKVYQIDALGVSREKKSLIRAGGNHKNLLRTKAGKVYKTNLTGKLLTLILNKASSLDPEGIGIEMEADKPGWCDSLNGLPALFGSSVCETFELKRAALILSSAINTEHKEGIKEVKLASEVVTYFRQLNSLLAKTKISNYDFWNKANSIKEDFRKKTLLCVSSEKKKISLTELDKFLKRLVAKLNSGLKRAKDSKTGNYFTYFTYTAKKYEQKNKHLVIKEFSKKPLPLFLEGPMHALRLEHNPNIHKSVKSSALFDRKLKMYKLNTSLENESLEIGRSRVFVPGWLENESVWLHMQYKYLLEVLKSGMHDEFFKAFHDCAVCFLDPETYGRNILENSSFIVSSVYPDKSLRGRGFVARLSGATAELLNIWIMLCLGMSPFTFNKNKGLILQFSPILPKELFTRNPEAIEFSGKKITLPENSFSFKLFSKILVCYHNPKRKDTFSKACKVAKIEITKKGRKITVPGKDIRDPFSREARNGQIERIDVYFS